MSNLVIRPISFRKIPERMFLVLFCLLAVANFNVAAKDVNNDPSLHPLKIAVINNDPPFSMVLSNGQMAGYLVDTWRLWSKRTGRTIIFVPGDHFQTIDSLRSGNADTQAGLFINHQRKKWADFSISIAKVRTGVYFSSNRLKSLSLAQMGDHKIAVGAGSYQESFLRSQYPKLNIEPFVDGQAVINQLIDGDVSAVVAEIPFMNAELGSMGLRGSLILGAENISSNTVHAVVRKGEVALLEIINTGFKGISLSKFVDLERKWFPEEASYFVERLNQKVPLLNIAEQEWLSLHPKLTIGVSSDFLPFESLDQFGQYSGISSEYLDFISGKLKLEFKPMQGLKWTEIMNKIKLGEIDLLPAVVKTENRARFLNFTKPYIRFPMVIATHKSSPIIQALDNLKGKRVGFEQSTPAEEILKSKHPQLITVSFQSANQGLRALEDKKIDAFVHNLAVITYQQNHQNLKDIQIAAFTPYEIEVAMGVRKGLEPMVSILEKTLDTINEKEKQGIANNWLSIQLDFGNQFTSVLRYLLPAAGFSLLVMFFVTRTNRKLQQEVNKRRTTEQSLAKAKANAEKANKAKDDFLANMSHEIRTPMNAIIGMCQLLAQTKITSSQKDNIDTLMESSQSLLILINEILDLSKIEAGKMHLESIPFDLKELITQIESNVDFGQKKNLVSFRVSVLENVPLLLVGDRFRLEQILQHLIENAIKFTNAGEVNLDISLNNSFTNGVELYFVIKDSGIGMTHQQLAGLFNTYNQVDSSSTRKYDGVGIGLSICKSLCQLMNGKIWAESQLGVGSEFHFTVQFGVLKDGMKRLEKSDDSRAYNSFSQSNDAYSKGDFDFSGKNILVVDDHITNQIVVAKMLKKVGVEVETAKNGLECLMFISEKNFDAILMDVQMPVMDGYVATRKIRENKKLPSIPIIALSANVMKSDVELALAAGMDAHLSKPIKVATLLETLAKCLSNKS